MKFVRFGGLSAIDYKPLIKKNDNALLTFHTPPRRYGIYAFIYPYVEDFLWAWKVKTPEEASDEESKKFFKKKYKELKRVFDYEGPIWCHFTEYIKGINSRAWVLTTTNELESILNKVKHADIVSLQKTDSLFLQSKTRFTPNIKNPYKQGLGGFMCKDHLEVFIEKKDLCRIG
jgi:hypothetical protein